MGNCCKCLPVEEPERALQPSGRSAAGRSVASLRNAGAETFPCTAGPSWGTVVPPTVFPPATVPGTQPTTVVPSPAPTLPHPELPLPLPVPPPPAFAPRSPSPGPAVPTVMKQAELQVDEERPHQAPEEHSIPHEGLSQATMRFTRPAVPVPGPYYAPGFPVVSLPPFEMGHGLAVPGYGFVGPVVGVAPSSAPGTPLRTVPQPLPEAVRSPSPPETIAGGSPPPHRGSVRGVGTQWPEAAEALALSMAESRPTVSKLTLRRMPPATPVGPYGSPMPRSPPSSPLSAELTVSSWAPSDEDPSARSADSFPEGLVECAVPMPGMGLGPCTEDDLDALPSPPETIVAGTPWGSPARRVSPSPEPAATVSYPAVTVELPTTRRSRVAPYAGSRCAITVSSPSSRASSFPCSPWGGANRDAADGECPCASAP
eukprot:RCo048219